MKKYLLCMIFLLTLNACTSQPASPAAPEEPAVSTETPIPASPEPTKASGPIAHVVIKLTKPDVKFKDPYGVAINSLGNIYVNDAGNSRVLVFDSAGALLSAWEAKGKGNGEFDSLGFGGIAIDSQDNVFVVDNGNFRIQKFDKDGNFVTEFGSNGSGEGLFRRVIGIAIDAQDNVYTTDDGSPYVQKFDNNGQFIFRFGGAGDADGKFLHATGITIDRNGNIYVSDYEKKNIQKFDKDGNFLMKWEISNAIGVQGIPEALAIDVDGRIYVSDYQLARIQVFDSNGTSLWEWTVDQDGKGLFQRPTGIAFDAAGNVYVANQSGNSLIVLAMPVMP